MVSVFDYSKCDTKGAPLLSLNSSGSFYLTAFDNVHLVKILK